MDFARQIVGLSRIVIGATSPSEIMQICEAARGAPSAIHWEAHEYLDVSVIDPAQWS